MENQPIFGQILPMHFLFVGIIEVPASAWRRCSWPLATVIFNVFVEVVLGFLVLVLERNVLIVDSLERILVANFFGHFFHDYH